MADKIVKELVKVDLHIHSAASIKDGAVVSENTIDNIDKLLNNLRKEEIDMIAITDHNAFDYDLYKKLKEHEGNELKKVLPGIEFDVEYLEKRVHVITIFDDKDDEKVKKITSIMRDAEFDAKDCFKEKTFKDILKNIDTNVLLIVHQKSGIRAGNQNENLAQIGEEKFDEIIGVDYFDAVEFRSGKVEGILNDYKNEKNLENLRYITGTDCHVWEVYPQQNRENKSDIKYSYLRCLPTFKGLVMSLTDAKRVSTSKYDITKPYIENLKININGKEKMIELSPGLNVMIGDNSIGKSLILENLIDSKFSEIKETSKREGYKKYLKDKKIKVVQIDETKKSKIDFDRQGEIREKFQSGTKLLDVDFFKDKFQDFDTLEYSNKINEIVNLFLEKTKENQKIKNVNNELDYDISIPAEIEEHTYRFRIVDDLENDAKNYVEIIRILKTILTNISKLRKIQEFKDIKVLKLIENKVIGLKEKYESLKGKEEKKSEIINVIKEICNKYEVENKETSETQDNILTEYKQNIIEARNRIVNKIKMEQQEEHDFLEDYEEISIAGKSNIINEYNFLKRTKCKKIDKNKIVEILSYPLSRVKNKSQLDKIDEDDLKSKLKRNLLDESLSSEENYKNIVTEYVGKEILKQETVILYKDKDISSGNSQGKNALIYLDVLSSDKSKNMYIVDQPGDDISHSNLNNNVIEIFRRMAINKQVLFVTHKPELVVNLDVDNAIILKEDENSGEVEITNGALEYENEEENVNILKDIANILDGGEETIRKRWKRYDK